MALWPSSSVAAMRSTLANLNGALSTAVGGMLFAMIVFGLAITLRIGSKQAHLLMTERLEDAEEPLPDLPRGDRS